MNKLICEACGNSFPADSAFCPFCGTKKKETCPSCGQYRIEIGSFCPFCGSSYDGTKSVAEPISIEKEAVPAPKHYKKRAVALVAAVVLLAVLNVVQFVILRAANNNAVLMEEEIAQYEKKLSQAKIEATISESDAREYRVKLKAILEYVAFAEDDGRKFYHQDVNCHMFDDEFYVCSINEAESWGYSPCAFCCD